MRITRLWCFQRSRRGPAVVLIVPVVTAFLGCAPVIETSLRDRQFPPGERMSVERISILLDTSRLERTSDTLDPARLKDKLVEGLISSGVFRQYRVEIADKPAESEPDGVTVVLIRLEYGKQGTRFPPAPPLGIACLYPFATPVLFERDYLKMEVTVEAELMVHDRSGAVASRTYLTESATGRANFFASGESNAATELRNIAFGNFSEQVVREFLFLTR